MGRRKKVSGETLRKMRKQTGYTQEQWGVILGISRETVSAIENDKPETMNSLEAEILAKWWEYSHHHIDNTLQQSFKDMVLNFFGFFR
ncbi:MAG: hypothetical protein Alis3KO_00780 [Aliiglaciecola sp.]